MKFRETASPGVGRQRQLSFLIKFNKNIIAVENRLDLFGSEKNIVFLAKYFHFLKYNFRIVWRVRLPCDQLD